MWAVFGFTVGAVWLLYVGAGYPALLALVARRRRIQPRPREDYTPRVSVLVAARNEERDIAWKIAETLDWDYPAGRLEVLVASDASEDRTDEILAAIGDPRLRWVRMEKRGGKGRALNRLAEMARGEVFFFTDANSHIGRDTLRKLVRHFADPRVGCVTGNSNREPAGEGRNVYWGHELAIRRWESEFGGVLVCDGAIFGIRSSLYTPVSPELANDLELPLRIAHAGYWLLHEPAAQVAEKETSSPAEEFTRRRRICAQGALGMWRLRHTLRGVRRWQFLSHKLLRWLLTAPLVLVLASSIALRGIPFFALALGAQLVFYAAAAAGLLWTAAGGRAGRWISLPLYVSVSCAGALAGVADAAAGRRFDVWDSPAMSRGGGSPE